MGVRYVGIPYTIFAIFCISKCSEIKYKKKVILKDTLINFEAKILSKRWVNSIQQYTEGNTWSSCAYAGNLRGLSNFKPDQNNPINLSSPL